MGPIAAGRLIYQPGPFRGPRGHRTAAGRHPWIPLGTYCIYLRKSVKNNRAVPGRYPAGPFKYATRRVLNGLFTGCLFDENARRIESRPFVTTAPVYGG